MSKLLDRLFWTSLVISIVAVCSSCDTLHAIGTVATTPDPVTGATPVEGILNGVTGVLINPLNWPAWAQIGASITVIAGGYATYKAKKKA